MVIEVKSEEEMKAFGKRFAGLLVGGEVIELIGDIGAGKTTMTKGIAAGMGVVDDVQSPSFTVSRVYQAAKGRTLAHYDFYRLQDPGIMTNELGETIRDARTVTVIEWAAIVANILPQDRITMSIVAPDEQTRRILVEAHGPKSQKTVRGIQ